MSNLHLMPPPPEPEERPDFRSEALFDQTRAVYRTAVEVGGMQRARSHLAAGDIDGALSTLRETAHRLDRLDSTAPR